MKITMIAAVDRNEHITRGDEPNPTAWTSEEDKQYLTQTISQFAFAVMGRKTYDIVKDNLSTDIFTVVLTRSPEDYADKEIDGVLKFENLSLPEFVEKYDGQSDCLVLGGSNLYRRFLDFGMVSKIYLTVEPLGFAKGIQLLGPGKYLDNYDLPAPTVTPLGDEGTELHTYDITPTYSTS